MVRKLTVTLAIALLMIVFAPMASADDIKTEDGTLVIPNGSQVTGVFLLPPGSFGLVNTFGVDFQFPGGTGSTAGNNNDGNEESIIFTVPVTNLSLTAVAVADIVTLSADGTVVLQCAFGGDPFFNPCPGTTGTFDLTLNGPIRDLQWDNFPGNGGIESLSFTAVDAGDPSTSSLIFLGVGLLGLLVSSRRKVPVCP